MKTVVAVDFDGTLVDHQYPKIGNPAPGAFAWLKRFVELQAKLILLTMRYSKELQEAVEHCHDHGITFWAVNDNPEQYSWTGSRKVYAHVYVDDAAVGCPLHRPPGFGYDCVDWAKAGPMVEKVILERINQ